MARHRPLAGAYVVGLIVGIPGFLILGNLFVTVVPAITAGLDALL